MRDRPQSLLRRPSSPFRALGVATFLLISAGCPIVLGPDRRDLLYLFDLQTPASATFADTIRIGFAYDGACGMDGEVRSYITSTRVEIEVRAPDGREDRICMAAAMILPVRHQVVLLPAPRSGDITVIFHQPGADSVRKIDILPAPLARSAP